MLVQEDISRMAFITYAQIQKIAKSNHFKILECKKIKGPIQY